ncbi:hypothetical protein SCUP515_05869 [Seiridium cupressi]
MRSLTSSSITALARATRAASQTQCLAAPFLTVQQDIHIPSHPPAEPPSPNRHHLPILDTYNLLATYQCNRRQLRSSRYSAQDGHIVQPHLRRNADSLRSACYAGALE